MKYFIPVLFSFIFIYSLIKKVKPYDAFIEGTKGTLPLIFNLFPYLIGIFILTELFEASGLSNFFTGLFSPIFNLLGIPNEITPLVILKPFSGSGSLAILSEIFKTYGADSYVSRCACTVFGSSETIFYISAVYFSKSKEKRLTKPIIISLVSTLFSTVIACLLCKLI